MQHWIIVGYISERAENAIKVLGGSTHIVSGDHPRLIAACIEYSGKYLDITQDGYIKLPSPRQKRYELRWGPGEMAPMCNSAEDQYLILSDEGWDEDRKEAYQIPLPPESYEGPDLNEDQGDDLGDDLNNHPF